MFTQQINRIQNVSGDRDENAKDREKKRRVLYQGRLWIEKEEDLTVRPPTDVPLASNNCAFHQSYVEPLLMKRAEEMFYSLRTWEEKVAQLCFIETEANYDLTLQRQVEHFIEEWGIGGIVFTRGSYGRQAYLIERYQALSKMQLLIANNFFHGISFYLQGDPFPKRTLSEKFLCDFGKAVMVQNRRLGVHIQMGYEENEEHWIGKEKARRAFSKGIRQAHGIIGKKTDKRSPLNYSPFEIGGQYICEKTLQLLASTDLQVQESIGFNTLTFFKISDTSIALDPLLLDSRKRNDDILLLNKKCSDTIQALCGLIRLGKIPESEINRHVLKIMIIKARFYHEKRKYPFHRL